jgi:ribonuclease-3
MHPLEEHVRYQFRNPQLRRKRLLIRAWPKQRQHFDNRPEFLGDAVLQLVITEYLSALSGAGEGRLTTHRSQLVSGSAPIHTTQLDLGRHLLVGRGERRWRCQRDSTLSDAYEALSRGYLDSDLKRFAVLSSNKCRRNWNDSKRSW